MIVDLDKKFCVQVDVILYYENFQKLELVWCLLKFLVDCINFCENVKIQIMLVSKDKLLEDFEDLVDIIKFGLYKNMYMVEYGQFGGQLFGVIVVNYEFGFGGQDIKLL